MPAHVKLRMRARFERVAAACEELRSRVRRGDRLRVGARALMFLVAALGAIVLAKALGTQGAARAALLLWGLLLLSFAGMLRLIANTPPAIDIARLALIEHLLAAFDDEICDDDVNINADLGTSCPYERWLHLAFRVRNDTIIHISRGSFHEQGFEKLTVGLVLPNGDLFGFERPQVTLQPPDGLTVAKIDVQSQAVVFELHGPLGQPVSGDLVVRTVESCRQRVAGLRSFSQPPCHPPRAEANAAEPAESPGSVGAEQATSDIASAIAAELTLDVAPATTGVTAGDLVWISEAAVDNLWEWSARDDIVDRCGLMHVASTRDQCRRLLEPAVAALLPLVHPAATDLPIVRWAPSPACFPTDAYESVRLTSERPGVWLVAHEGSIVARSENAQNDLAEPRVVAPLPANFDPTRQAALAYDPERNALGLWMRAWARTGSRTFLWNPSRSAWTEHRHPFRPEDEHAGVTFLFDHARSCFAHIGVTYSRLWTGDDSHVEHPAGLLQLALSAKGRIAVSDPDTAITLLVDFEHGRIARCADHDWDLVATIEPSAAFDPKPRQWSLLPQLYRYDAARKHLLWQERRPRSAALTLDLTPAFARAAATSNRPL